MVKIRLKEGGKRNHRQFRVVIIDSKKKRDGAVLDTIGYYNPITDKSDVKLDTEKVDEWVKQGAQLTERVAKLVAIAKGEVEYKPRENKKSKKTIEKEKAEKESKEVQEDTKEDKTSEVKSETKDEVTAEKKE